MKMAGPNEAQAFVTEAGFGGVIGAEMPGKFVLRYNFEHEDHRRSPYTLAKYLASLTAQSHSTLVILDNMYVWPSGRDEYLIRQVLAALLATPPARLTDKTAILWTAPEQDAAATLYHLALLFGWDAYIIPKSGSTSAFISHDSFIDLHTDADPSDLANAALNATTRSFTLLNG